MAAKFGFWSSVPAEEARRLLLDLDEAKGAIVEHYHFHRQTQLHQAEEIAHQHCESAVTG